MPRSNSFGGMAGDNASLARYLNERQCGWFVAFLALCACSSCGERETRIEQGSRSADAVRVARDKEMRIEHGRRWRLSGGELVPLTDIAAIAGEPLLSQEPDHLVVPLRAPSPCGTSWVTENCVPWANSSLFQCGRDWMRALDGAVSIEGTVLGDTTTQVVIVDARGAVHRAVVRPQDGSFRVKVGADAEPVHRVRLAPVESSSNVLALLWLHGNRINFRATGVTWQKAGPTWFARGIAEGSPGALSAIELGDVLLSMNGRSLVGAEPEVLEKALELDLKQTRVEYSRCGSRRDAVLARVPLAALWSIGGECPCPTDACPPVRRQRTTKIAEAPRTCAK